MPSQLLKCAFESIWSITLRSLAEERTDESARCTHDVWGSSRSWWLRLIGRYTGIVSSTDHFILIFERPIVVLITWYWRLGMSRLPSTVIIFIVVKDLHTFGEWGIVHDLVRRASNQIFFIWWVVSCDARSYELRISRLKEFLKFITEGGTGLLLKLFCLSLFLFLIITTTHRHAFHRSHLVCFNFWLQDRWLL